MSEGAPGEMGVLASVKAWHVTLLWRPTLFRAAEAGEHGNEPVRQVSMGTLSRKLLIGVSSVAVLGPLLAVGMDSAPPAGADTATFSITVNASSSAAVPYGSAATLAETGLPNAATGTVTFSNSLSVTLCTAKLPAPQCTSPDSLTPGTYLVTATYSGDGTYSGSTSTNSVSLTVLAPTTTVASASPDDTASGTSVTYSAVVTSNYGVPTGTVNFRTPAKLLCTGTLSGDTASCDATTAPIGTYNIKATYVGDGVSARSVGTTTMTVFRATSSLSCAKLSGNAATSIKLALCTPYSGLDRTASAPASFLVSGGTLTWSRSFQTSTVSLTSTSPGQGGCPKKFIEHDLTGEVTGGSSLYTLPDDPVAWRVCQSVRTGAVHLAAGTDAEL